MPRSWTSTYYSSTTRGPGRSSGQPTKPRSSFVTSCWLMQSKTRPQLLAFRFAGFPSRKDSKTRLRAKTTSRYSRWRRLPTKPTNCAAFRPRRCPPWYVSTTTWVCFFTMTASHHFAKKSSQTSSGLSKSRRHYSIHCQPIAVTTRRSSNFCTSMASSLKASPSTSGRCAVPMKQLICHLLNSARSSSVSTRASACCTTPVRRWFLRKVTPRAAHGFARLLSACSETPSRHSQDITASSVAQRSQLPATLPTPSRSLRGSTSSAEKAICSTPSSGDSLSSAFASSTRKSRLLSCRLKTLECHRSSTGRLVFRVTPCSPVTTCASRTSTKAWSWLCCARQPPSKRSLWKARPFTVSRRCAASCSFSSRRHCTGWEETGLCGQCGIAWDGAAVRSQARRARSMADLTARLQAATTSWSYRARFRLVRSASARRQDEVVKEVYPVWIKVRL